MENKSLSPGIFEHGRFPFSRDWELEGQVSCGRKNCVANRSGKCISPSLLKIGEDGKCEGYTNRNKSGE